MIRVCAHGNEPSTCSRCADEGNSLWGQAGTTAMDLKLARAQNERAMARINQYALALQETQRLLATIIHTMSKQTFTPSYQIEKMKLLYQHITDIFTDPGGDEILTGLLQLRRELQTEQEGHDT